MYQNAGEKGDLHEDPDDPPRRRANKVRGHGSWANDRPPIAGVVGRESGSIHVQVCPDSGRGTRQPFVETHTRADATVNTDAWQAYHHLAATGRCHATVCHAAGQREWARDDDADGIREVHCNTREGIWTGVRHFLRPFRGVHKRYLSEYIAVFQWAHHLKRLTMEFLRAVMLPFTLGPT